jgi:5'-3' exonuclease
MTQIVLVDGKNQIYRMQYSPGLKPMKTSDGHPTGALFGCLNYSMLSIASRLPDASFVWVWDGGGETWRHKMMMDRPQINATSFPEEDETVYANGLNPSTEFFSDFDSMVESSIDFLGLNKKKKDPKERKRPKHVGYKGQRNYSSSSEKNKDKYPVEERQRALIQIPVLKLILEGSGFRNFQVQGLEGDDLVCMLATRILELDDDAEVIILSQDRDYYQLLAKSRIKICTGVKDQKLGWVKYEEVKQRFGISPRNWTRYRALTGDKIDNIPHLWKVGGKTAVKMLEAGLDPSESDYKKIPEDVRNQFKRYFEPHGISKMWPSMYGNYQLCKLVSDPESELLSSEVRHRLAPIFEKLISIRKFQRRNSCLTSEAYRKVSFLLMQYELKSVLEERDLLWKIP